MPAKKKCPQCSKYAGVPATAKDKEKPEGQPKNLVCEVCRKQWRE